jgi:hypothetical protein
MAMPDPTNSALAITGQGSTTRTIEQEIVSADR